jgi:hypothetical protein
MASIGCVRRGRWSSAWRGRERQRGDGSAVHQQVSTCDERGRRAEQKVHRARNLFGGTHPARRRASYQLMHELLVGTREFGAMTPGLTELTRAARSPHRGTAARTLNWVASLAN